MAAKAGGRENNRLARRPKPANSNDWSTKPPTRASTRDQGSLDARNWSKNRHTEPGFRPILRLPTLLRRLLWELRCCENHGSRAGTAACVPS